MCHDHLQRLVIMGAATILSAETSQALCKHLESLPWAAGRLDWSRLPVRAVDLSITPAIKLKASLAASLIGQDSHVVFLFGPGEPSLACSAAFAFLHLDTVFWKAPGPRYLFGASVQSSTVTPAAAHWAEYDGAHTLRAAM